jgi:Arc/MetJ-type ribon-helix-helix transcriptional regulator
MKMTETEKITINVGAVDLGKIDLLVEQGHYSNRTDFIRSAIRSQLEKHTLEVQQAVVRSSYVVGAFLYNRADLEKYKARNEQVKVSVVGFFNLANDVSPTLAVEVVESIKVYGIFQARDDVKDALAKAGKIK